MWQHVISSKLFVSDLSGKDDVSCSGKWIVEFPLDDPDEVWERLVHAACDGLIDATKRSSPRLDAIVGHHLACVYCRSSDPEYAARTLAVLREMGIEGPLRYKSDLATVQGREEYLWVSEEIEAAHVSVGPDP